MAGPWLAVMVVFRMIGGFSTGSGLVPACPILPGGVVPTPSSWTQVFKVHGLGLVQMYLFYYRLEFCCSFQSLWLLGWLRRGLVRVSTTDMEKVPGGFGATRTATLCSLFSFHLESGSPLSGSDQVAVLPWLD